VGLVMNLVHLLLEQEVLALLFFDIRLVGQSLVELDLPLVQQLWVLEK
jgi:hypothetical protein